MMDKEKQSKLRKLFVSSAITMVGLWLMVEGLISYAEFGSPAQIGYGFLIMAGGIFWMLKLFRR